MMDTSSQKRTIRRKPMTRAMKDSGIEWIGQIPENYTICKVKNIFKIGRGRVIAQTELKDNGLYPVYSSQTLNNGCMGYINTYDFDKPQLTWTTDGANAGTVFLRTGKYNCTNVCGTLSPITKICNLSYMLYNISYIAFFHKRIDTNGYKIMNNEMGNIEILLPPLTEQKKIADYLDKRCEKIDTAIDNQKQIIEKLKEYKQSLITETVTKGLNPNVKLKDSGIEWIGSIPEHWEIKKLKYLFKIKKNIAGKEGFDILSVTQSGIKIKDISTNEGQIAQDYSKYQIVNIDDFIMNHMDLLTGFVDCSHFNGVTSPDYRVFCQIEPTTNSNLYYNYIFQQCYKNKIFYGLGQGVSGLGRWRLPSDMFLNFTLPQPPLSEQKEIAEYLDTKCNQIDEAIKQKEETISKLEEYKKSLIFECVTGKKEVA